MVRPDDEPLTVPYLRSWLEGGPSAVKLFLGTAVPYDSLSTAGPTEQTSSSWFNTGWRYNQLCCSYQRRRGLLYPDHHLQDTRKVVRPPDTYVHAYLQTDIPTYFQLTHTYVHTRLHTYKRRRIVT